MTDDGCDCPSVETHRSAQATNGSTCPYPRAVRVTVSRGVVARCRMRGRVRVAIPAAPPNTFHTLNPKVRLRELKRWSSLRGSPKLKGASSFYTLHLSQLPCVELGEGRGEGRAEAAPGAHTLTAGGRAGEKMNQMSGSTHVGVGTGRCAATISTRIKRMTTWPPASHRTPPAPAPAPPSRPPKTCTPATRPGPTAPASAAAPCAGSGPPPPARRAPAGCAGTGTRGTTAALLRCSRRHTTQLRPRATAASAWSRVPAERWRPSRSTAPPFTATQRVKR